MDQNGIASVFEIPIQAGLEIYISRSVVTSSPEAEENLFLARAHGAQCSRGDY